MNHPVPASTLAQRMRQTPYQAYSYSYPHKSAYRALEQPVPLQPLWAGEDRSSLFAYIHVPFCEMRCGFCNLFAMANPGEDLVERYVSQVVRQMRVLNDVLGERRFARFALGGGTPTFLQPHQLETLLRAANDILGISLDSTSAGIEASPETATADRLQLCRSMGIDRVSLGIQSFSAPEMKALARPQQNDAVRAAIERIRAAGFPTLNLDLIYGIAGQTIASLLASIDSALEFMPEELYLYPLYVRQHTGLGKLAQRRATGCFEAIALAPDGDSRLQLYIAARDHLRARGYVQVSMRMFRAPRAPVQGGPSYCCQDDGMVGMGTGARSYTRSLHYSTDYAVGRTGTMDIIKNYLAYDDEEFTQARHGFHLSADEQRRRFVIQSLLTEPGLDLQAYARRFGGECLDHLPGLLELPALGLAEQSGPILRLNDMGYAYADTIGPWLASDNVQALMASGGASC
ncbi:STM4012 family radical SAM protein [Pseudoduganella violaceinigra]|uniref:STM4012 family radical SAM protein n=1 Tax=Pseudoduganella violaceinigra TaxID=246602 RepID=UPI001E49AB81|nr:STM4012 family radical SAM protein [Pseudoduganella violaceinigra]